MGAQEQGANAVENRWLTIPRTLCFVLNGDDVLLMKRAAHKRVFPNRYNGVGGHIERDEDPLTSARREIKEETGLDVRDVRLRAVYNIDAGEATGIMLFVFTAVSDRRDVCANREGTLHWVARGRAVRARSGRGFAADAAAHSGDAAGRSAAVCPRELRRTRRDSDALCRTE